MGTTPTKAADNMYCQHRLKAAKYNDKLRSREGAAEAIGVSPSAMADYELGNIKVVPVDKVNTMAEVYNAPELRSWYCSTQCPLGVGNVRQIDAQSFDRMVNHVVSVFRKAAPISNILLDVAEDGRIDKSEVVTIEEIAEEIIKIMLCCGEFMLWREKNLKGVQ